MALVRVVRSPRRQLQLVNAVAGAAFIYYILETPSLTFAQLPKAIATDFHGRNGFFHVMRWLEHLRSPERLSAFLAKLHAFNEATRFTMPRSSVDPTVRFRSSEELLTYITELAHWETYLLASKMALQWGLIVFLSRNKAISSKLAVSTVCLAILALMCAKIAQSCVLEVLSTAPSPPPSDDRDTQRAAFLTAFLGMLFLVRFATSAAANAILARGYQVYFGGVPARWKDVPRYIGSKDFALSTLFFTVAAVSGIAVSATPLRSLSEAAQHIESVALVVAWVHFLVYSSGLTAAVAPSDESDTSRINTTNNKTA